MRSRFRRLELLELAARHLNGSRQLDLMFAAARGDVRARRRFAALRDAGELRGKLGELYDCLTHVTVSEGVIEPVINDTVVSE